MKYHHKLIVFGIIMLILSTFFFIYILKLDIELIDLTEIFPGQKVSVAGKEYFLFMTSVCFSVFGVLPILLGLLGRENSKS